MSSGKKPIFKRWWFWLIVIILIIAFVNGGEEGGDSTKQESVEEAEVTEEENVEEDTAEQAEEDADEEEEAAADNEEDSQKLTRDNSSAEETTLNTGTFTVGEDISEGRYVITGDGSGNLFVYDGDFPVVNEILDPTGEFGVKSVTTDIKDGQQIEISGISNVTFTPAETSISNILTTGTWIVGLDIAPGRYDAAAPSGSGNFFVYDGSWPKVNEILDASGEFGVEKVTVDLEEGQIIEISGLNEVEFTEN